MAEDNEKRAQEMYMQFQAMDQHIKQLQKQLEAVTGQLMELDASSYSLDEFRKISPEKEILLPLSSGIFAKASIKDASELLVNVGANVVVQKNVDSAKRLIQSQIEEIKKIQKQLVGELEKMMGHAAQIEMQLQSLVSKG